MTGDLKLADYERLLASLSHKAFRRAAAKGFYVEFDDMFQEAKQTFLVAADKFDPDLGIKFSTYLWAAVRNNLQRIESKIIAVQIKTSSMDAEIGEDVGTMHDIVPSDNESMDDRLLRLEFENKTFGALSEEAKRVIIVLDSPPTELAKELRRMEAFREHCKKNKMAAAARVLDVHTICSILRYDQKTVRKVKRELKQIVSGETKSKEPILLDEVCYACGKSFACDRCEGAFEIGDILYGKD